MSSSAMMTAHTVPYTDGQQIFDLLDRWNYHGPPVAEAVQDWISSSQRHHHHPSSSPGQPRQQRTMSACPRFGVRQQTLLHKCLETYGDRLDLLSTFIQAWPEALTMTDSQGWLPIHVALRQQQPTTSMDRPYDPLPAIKLMLQYQQPDQALLQLPNAQGAMPLHWACQYYGGGAYEDRSGEAVGTGSSESAVTLIKTLIDGYPRALITPDYQGRTPWLEALDRADQVLSTLPTRRSSSSAAAAPILVAPLWQCLLVACPAMLRETIPHDDTGAWPLHRAVQQVLDLLYDDDDDDDYDEEDDDGDDDDDEDVSDANKKVDHHRPDLYDKNVSSWPEHLMFAVLDALERVQLLVRLFPRALSLQRMGSHHHRPRGDGGETPLMLACTKTRVKLPHRSQTHEDRDRISISLIYNLIRPWPEQIQSHGGVVRMIFTSPDTPNGELDPYALACRRITLRRVEAWIHHQGRRVLSQVIQPYGRSPLHYAVVSTSPQVVDIVRYLLKQDIYTDQNTAPRHQVIGTMAQRRDVYGRLPLHYAVLSRAPSSTVARLARMLVQANPEGLLLHDLDGCLSWHYAVCAGRDELADEMLERIHELDPDLECDMYDAPYEVQLDLVQYIRTDLVENA